MTSVALHVYEQLTEAQDEKTRARIIAEALERLEERIPPLQDLATASQVRETELRLQKEIKEVEARLQKEIREVEARLQKEIREVELRLQKEIEQVKLEIEKVRSEIGGMEIRLQKQVQAVEVRLAETKSELVRWVVAVGVLQSSLIIAVLLKVAHLI